MAEPIGNLVVRIGGDATDLIDAFRRGAKAADDFKSKLDTTVQGLKALAVALEVREIEHFITSIAEADDALGKMAERTGIAVEQLSALKYAGSLADVSVQDLGTGLKNLAKVMVDAKSGSAEARQGFVALFGGGWTMKPLEQQLLDVADKFQKMEDGAGKTAIALRLFGKSGEQLIPLLNQGSEGLRQNTEEARKLGIILSTEASKQAAEFNDNLKRLQASSEAFARTLAGPVIEALSKAAAEMVKAKKEGEDFFATWVRGWRMLFTGDDAHKWNEQFVTATNRLLEVQNKLDESKATFNLTKAPFDADEVKRWTAEVAKAQAEIARLRSIKQIIAPEEAPKVEDKKKKAPELPDLAKLTKDAEAEARRIVDAEEEAAKESREAWEFYYQFLRNVGSDTTRVLVHDADELAQMMTDGASAGVEFVKNSKGEIIAAFKTITMTSGQAFLDFADDIYQAEQTYQAFEQEVNEGAQKALNDSMVLRGNRLEALTQEILTEEGLENRRYDDRIAQLQQFSDDELSTIGGRQAVEQQMEQEHQYRLLGIRSQGLNTLSAFQKASFQQQAKTIFEELANITAGVSQHNRTLFEINKVAGIANAIIHAYEGISLTMSKYPYPLNIGMAALHAAAAFAQVSSIASTSYGSNSAPSISGSTAAAPVTPVDSGTPRSHNPDTIIHLHGEVFSRDTMRALFDQMNEEARDGGRIVVAG